MKLAKPNSHGSFLIRHGQTEGNVARRHQHANTPLNDEGIRQAQALARAIHNYQPTHLVTSRQHRALATAKEISIETGLTPHAVDEFIELVRPDYLVGERRVGWRMMMYMFLWYMGYCPASHYDGESYQELRLRVKQARAYLETFPKNAKVAVVSHAGFIVFFQAHLGNTDKPLSALGALRALGRMVRMKNTQIFKLTFDGQKWRKRR